MEIIWEKQRSELYLVQSFLYPENRHVRSATAADRKPTEVTLLTMILYKSENSIRDIKPFCRPLFCHSHVVKYTSSFLQ